MLMEESASIVTPTTGAGSLSTRGLRGQHTAHDGRGIAHVRPVGHAHGKVELPDIAVVVQDFTDDFPVGNDDPRLVRMHQRGREEFDFCHLPLTRRRSQSIRRREMAW